MPKLQQHENAYGKGDWEKCVGKWPGENSHRVLLTSDQDADQICFDILCVPEPTSWTPGVKIKDVRMMITILPLIKFGEGL